VSEDGEFAGRVVAGGADTSADGVADGSSLCDGVFENSALETMAALAATPTTSAPLLMLTTLINCDHMF
jgi:hypothetical protein